MKHAVILAHPTEESFNGSVARTYAEAVTRLGHQAIIRDLYKMDFDPRLKAAERPDTGEQFVADDVAAERALLSDCDVFTFVYPIWFATPPAILKGYIERVFNHGFAFEHFEGGHSRPLLEGRYLTSFTSSGSTSAWLEENGVWVSLRTLFDNYVAKICGLTVLDHVHFSSVTPGLGERFVLERLEVVRAKVNARFSPAKLDDPSSGRRIKGAVNADDPSRPDMIPILAP